MPGSRRPQRSATLLAAALLAVALAGCGNSNDSSHTGTHGDGTHRPVTTITRIGHRSPMHRAAPAHSATATLSTGFRWCAAT